MAQSIFGEGVSSALDDHGVRSVEAHAGVHHFFEEFEVGAIIDALL